MSLTVRQIVMDAKSLAEKFKDTDNIADALLTQGQNVQQQMDIMKQYIEDANELNKAAGHRPHAALVAGIKQENRQLRDLQQENRELRLALEEQQNVLEMIMSKYRQQMSKLMCAPKVDFEKLYNNQYTNVIIEQDKKMKVLTEIILKAIEFDDECSVKKEEEIKRLTIENEGLRKLLSISKRNETLLSTSSKNDDSSNA